MFVSLMRFIVYGWIDPFFVAPEFHFKYFGFGWVEPLPGPLMHAVFAVLAVLALGVAFNVYFRFSAITFAIGFSYLQLIDVATYLNHYYLAALFAWLLAFSPADRPRASVPIGWLYLFRFQVGIVYFCAGLAKLNSDWLLHFQPLNIWLGARTGMPILGPLFASPYAAPLMSWAGFLFDTTIVGFLLFRRTRYLAFGAVLVFHTLTRLLFPIGMFPWIMILGALVFLIDPRPRERLEAPRRFAMGFGVALAAIYVAIQIALPLRSRLYDGDVSWHERGMRFSWRVMVREKNGSITYVVENPRTGLTRHVSPSAYLTRVQERELSGQPDLILQLAHHIRDDFDARGLGPVEVYADAPVSLNGRRARPLIDPRIDLAQVADSIGAAPWIMPGPSEAPPRLRPIPVAARKDSER